MNQTIQSNETAHSPQALTHDARECFSARLLTDAQYFECKSVARIIEREILYSGTFKEKLGDYAYALARSQKFDVAKAETILRDVFKASTGQSMNQMRESLAKGLEAIDDDHRQQAYQSACDIGDLMENGEKLSFNRAFATQAQNFAREFGITDIAAKRIMSDEFNKAEDSKLYDWGKELDEQFFRPQIESEKQQREASESSNGRTGTRTKSKTARRTRQRVRNGPQ